MKRLDTAALLLLAVCVARSLAASEFVVVAAMGVVEPDGLAAGQQLATDTRLRLEPWGRVLIRETAGCGLTHVVAGVSEHPLAPADDCSAHAEPMEVAARVQQGEVFAARLKETGSGQADDLVRALSNEPCAFLPRFSEEGDARGRCPSGYALRGLRCTGSFCDDKDLLCCPYLGGASDPGSKELQSHWISEEWPNVLQSKQFVNGLSCRGLYCDDLLASQFKSPHLVNAKACEWSVWSSERPGTWLDCSLGRFVAGLRCRGDYCAEVALYCCRARSE